MTYNVENLFATPIYRCLVENKELVQSEIEVALKDIKYDDSYNYNQLGNTFETTDVDADIISEKQIDSLSQAIDFHLKQYCQKIGFTPREYKRKSWIVKNSNNGHTMAHTHGEYDIAGVYYFQTNEKDGNLFFESPVLPAISSICYQKCATRQEQVPIVGKLLLFPGWLSHGVKTNTQESDRISLAFMIAFTR